MSNETLDKISLPNPVGSEPCYEAQAELTPVRYGADGHDRLTEAELQMKGLLLRHEMLAGPIEAQVDPVTVLIGRRCNTNMTATAHEIARSVARSLANGNAGSLDIIRDSSVPVRSQAFAILAESGMLSSIINGQPSSTEAAVA